MNSLALKKAERDKLLSQIGFPDSFLSGLEDIEDDVLANEIDNIINKLARVRRNAKKAYCRKQQTCCRRKKAGRRTQTGGKGSSYPIGHSYGASARLGKRFRCRPKSLRRSRRNCIGRAYPLAFKPRQGRY